MLDPIGTTNSTDNALFDDKNRLMKIEQVLYIEAIVYIKTFLLMFKKYKESTSDIKLDVGQLINDISSGYQSFLEFNPDVSQKYNMESSVVEEESKEQSKEEKEKEEKEKEDEEEKVKNISAAEGTVKKYISAMVTEVSAAANVTSNAVKKLNDELQDNLDTSATFQYSLLDSNQNALSQGSLTMGGQDYQDYATNTYAWDWIATQLNLTIIGDYVPPVVEPIVTEEIITE